MKIKLFVFAIFTAALSSCTTIGNIISTPSYSVHTADKIILEKNREPIKTVYLRQSTSSDEKIYSKVMNDLRKKLDADNIQVVDDINKTSHVLSINIRNVAYDVDADFANKSRKTLLNNDLNQSYSFDNSNSPHAVFNKFEGLKNENNSGFGGLLRRRNVLPSTLFTLGGAGVGFYAGYLIAGSTAPVAFGVLGAIALGGTSYALYSSFKDVGVIITYDVMIEERVKRPQQHNRKLLVKTASNAAEETFYSYNDNWNKYVSKYAVIGIGSRALQKQMINKMCPMIAGSVVKLFEK